MPFILLLLFLLLPVPLLAQADAVGPTQERLRVGLEWQEATPPADSQSLQLAELRRETTGWVKGGIIGGIAGAALSVAVTHIFDQMDHTDAPYLSAALIGAFAGFVIGSLIGGS